MWPRFSAVLWCLLVCFGQYGGYGNAQWVVDDAGCRTPDRGTGTCVPLKQCEPMVSLLKNVKRPISQQDLKIIQGYTCGTAEGAGVKVCCPPGPISLGSARVQEPPDVSQHKNLKLLPKNCGYLDTDNRIVNGEDAYLNEFPWMALFSYNTDKGPKWKCAGTIINKNYILTAAHCISGVTYPLVKIRVGEYSIGNETDCEVQNDKKKTLKCNPPVQDLTIQEVIPHPEFSLDSFQNDIGLLRVSDINLAMENARPVCLPTGELRKAKFNNVVVTGWGVNNTETGQTSDILQKVTLPIANKTSCTSTYKDYSITLTEKQVCAGGVKKKDSCPGDSGGPMMAAGWVDDDAKYIQQGIVSFGPKYCGIPGYPGVYTVVPYYMDWILDNLKP